MMIRAASVWGLLIYLLSPDLAALAASRSAPSPKDAKAKGSESKLSSPARSPEPLLEGVRSPVASEFVRKLHEQFKAALPAKGPVAKGANALEIHAYALDSLDSLYMGIEQSFDIAAPLATVEQVLDDFGHYAELFNGYKDIHELSHTGQSYGQRSNQTSVISWEQIIPVPFVSNVIYQTTYLLDKQRSDRKIYRYQLRKGEGLRYSDGLIVIDRVDDKSTHFWELDLFDADWGVLKTLAPKTLWNNSIKEVFIADMAIKYRCEDSSLSYKAIQRKAKQEWPDYPIEEVLKNKKLFSPEAFLESSIKK